MSESVPPPAEKPARRLRLVWTLLGAMVLVAVVPLVVSHYSLIGINRDALETLEKKYLTRSAVSISSDLQNLLTNSRQQLGSIGGGVGLVSLRRIVERIREEGKGDVTAFIVDRDGRVLVHSEPAIEVQHPDFSGLQIVKDFSRAPQRLTVAYKDKGVKLLGTVAPAPPNLGVIVQKPEARAFASVDQMIRATLQWVAIAL